MPDRVVVTSAGIAAAIATLNAGFNLSITTYRLGSSYNYQPLSSDTALRGSTLYNGSITEVVRTAFDTLTFKIVINSDVGPFLFGEIGLYTDTGILFALVSLQSRFQKLANTTTERGNVFRIEVPIQLDVSQGTPIPTPTTVVVAKLNEVGTPNLLPEAVIASGNTYILQNASNPNQGRRTIAFIPTGDSLFQFVSYSYWLRGLTVVTSVPIEGKITFTTTSPIPPNLVTGDYIIQWSSGSVMSQCSYVTDIVQTGNNFSITFQTPTRLNVPIGATFDLMIHNEYLFSVMTSMLRDWVATSYPRNSLVRHNNRIWMALVNVTGSMVPGSSTNWVGVRSDNVLIPTADLDGLIQSNNIPWASVSQANAMTTSNVVMSPARTLNSINTRLSQITFFATGLVTGGGTTESDRSFTVTESTDTQAAALIDGTTVITPRRLGTATNAFLAGRTVTGAGLATGGGPLNSNQVITVTESTPAQASALTDGSTVVTPRRMGSAINAFLAGRTVTGAGLATGGGSLDSNQVITVTAATQAQSEQLSGQSNTVTMTPLRAHQAITARLGNVSISVSGLVTGGGSLDANRTVNVTRATVADINNGTENDRAITPQQLYSAYSTHGLNASAADISNLMAAGNSGKSGFFYFASTASNKPSSFGGMLINAVYNASNQMQLVSDNSISNNEHDYYVRKRVSGTWTSFATLWNSGNVGMTIGSNSFHTYGQIKFPNGFTVLVSRINALTHRSTYTFPIAFDTACIGVVFQDTSGDPTIVTQYQHIMINFPTRTNVQVWNQPISKLGSTPWAEEMTTATSAQMIAIGY